jgi:predicted permease
VGVRAALGAGRTAAVRPLFLEVVVLGLLGDLAGVLLAMFGLEVLVKTAPAQLPRLDAIGIDIRVVLAAFVLALAVAGLASLFPILRLRPNRDDAGILAGRLRGGTAGRGHHRAQAVFAVAQMALALAVLTGATLLARSFYQLTRIHPGYQPERLFGAQIDLPQSRYADGNALVRFTQQVTATLQASPDVEAVSFVTSLPQHGLNNFSISSRVTGRPADAEPVSAHYRGVAPRYFETAGIPLLQGRLFESGDHSMAPRAAIINEEFSRRFFPNGTALNQLVEDSVQIVGIVGSVKYGWPGADPLPEIYVPYYGEASTVFLVARARTEAGATAAMRSAVHAADPLIPVDVLSSEQLLMNSTAEQRFALLLVCVLAAIAVALAAVGLYGVISYAVSERTREFAIRVALGLPAPEIVGLVLRRGARIAIAGSAVGLLLAINGSRLLQDLLFEVSPRDPIMLAAAVLVLVLLALFATWWPARRASWVDPAMALRNE